jgi:hypothetical protein
VNWWKTLPAERQDALRAGIGADTEARLIDAWRSSTA